jgi:hypothetical protein
MKTSGAIQAIFKHSFELQTEKKVISIHDINKETLRVKPGEKFRLMVKLQMDRVL